MTDLLPIPRFPLPDDWTVEDTTCVVFRVPDDQQYISQIIGLVDLLKWSRNFDRDATGTGAATVSRTWQAALESEPIIVEDCEDLFMQFRLRQNPSNQCQLQQSLDGGVTWTLAFDYSLCGLSVPGGGTDPGGGGSGGGDGGGIISPTANNIVNNLHVPLIQQTVDLCGSSRTDAIAALTNYMRTYDPTYANPSALGQLYDQICALGTEEKADLADSCKLLGRLLPEYEGWSSCDNPDDLYSWLNCASEWIYQQLNEASDWLLATLNLAASAISQQGLINFAGGGGGGGGSGFGTGCDYWLVPFASVTKVVPSGADPECYTWSYSLPAGYEIQGLWLAHTVSANVSPFYAVYLGEASCEISTPTGGERIVHGGSVSLSPLYPATMFVPIDGDGESVFSDVGFSVIVADPTSKSMDRTVFQLTGEKPIIIVAEWRSSSDDGISGALKPTLILKQVP